MRLKLFILVLLTGMTLFPHLASGVPIYGDPPVGDTPLLQIEKWASDTDFRLGTSTTVRVNITNWSTQSAYNLTISEPRFSEWSAKEISGYEEYEYDIVDQDGSIYYEYEIVIQNDGFYTIHPTVITYFDADGFDYIAKSYHIDLNVFSVDPPLDDSEVWGRVLNISLLIIMVPIIALTVNRYVWRKT
jgi:hypothetical protein